MTALVILLTHSAIGHKEYRFLMPLLVILVVSASLGLVELLQTKRLVGMIAGAALALGSIDGARRYDWNDLAPRPGGDPAPTPLWSFRGASITSFEALSTNDSVCGLATIGMGWGWTGGYSHLHKNVALFDIRNRAEFDANWHFFNTMVASGTNGPAIGVFTRMNCWDELCLYQRSGTCDPPGDYSMNSWLKSTNM